MTAVVTVAEQTSDEETDDFFGDMSPIVAGYHGRDRDNGFVDYDLAGFIPAGQRHRSMTANDADPTAEDLQGQARRVWDAMPAGDVACRAVQAALVSETRADGLALGEMGRLLRLVRLGEQGHHGGREVAQQWAAQCRSKPRDQQRMLAYAVGYTIRDGLTSAADRGCCPAPLVVVRRPAEGAEEAAEGAEPSVANQEEWKAFLSTFKSRGSRRQAENRELWLFEALQRSSEATALSTWMTHARKAFTEVVEGRYSAWTAATFLEDQCPAPHEDRSYYLRVALAAALTSLEEAS